jgi:hypothetical protein
MCILTRDDSTKTPESTSPHDMATCFAGSKEIEFEQFPMKPSLIAHEQQKDKWIQKRLRKNRRDLVHLMKVKGRELLSYLGKILVPDSLQGRIIAWYHKYLAHPGINCLEATIQTGFVCQV